MTSPREHEPTDLLVYVNWARIGMSPFELTLDLGHRQSDDPPPEFPVRAVMTWEQAKSLHGLMGESISWYEEAVGPIRDLGMETGEAREVADRPSLPAPSNNPDEEV